MQKSSSEQYKKAEEALEVSSPFSNSTKGLLRRVFFNRLSEWVVRAGGFAVLFSILAIFVVILCEALPLLWPTKIRSAGGWTSSASIFFGINDNNTLMYSIQGDGKIIIRPLSVSQTSKPVYAEILLPEGENIFAVKEQQDKNKTFVVSRSGKLYQVDFDVNSFLPENSNGPIDLKFVAELASAEVLDFSMSTKGNHRLFAGLSEGSRINFVKLSEKRSLGGEAKFDTSVFSIEDTFESAVTKIALSEDTKKIFLGTANGKVLYYDLTKSQPQFIGEIQLGASPISALEFLIGGQTLVTADEAGHVMSWQFVDGLLKRIHSFKEHTAIVKQIVSSKRNRTFLSLAANGEIHVNYATTGDLLVTLQTTADSIQLSPKSDLLLTANKDGSIQRYDLINPHPETTSQSLFLPVWYEGYQKPTFVWQSSSGSDEFEPKLSLVPLIFGTLKGTFYSLLIAVPLAVIGALYTAEFMSARLKSFLKPLIELMAALPSVVIGFIAGVWLAPLLGSYVLSILLFLIVLPLTTAIFYRLIIVKINRTRMNFGNGREALYLLPVVILSIGLAYFFGDFVEQNILHDNFQHWLLEKFSVVYDQRNSLLVGLAMGFAVIPIIFTIADDALSSVPKQLRAASLALGASRWQTAWKVVLPAASPGIFSAIMLGFGRAVGETMIVLMATGNTPLMDLSVFNGFRALSANIAVELPEAAVGSTLFRVLFLAALLLFCFTFVVNTATEVIRVRLRRRFGNW